MAKGEDTYEIDPVDGLRRELVGEWCDDKHARLRAYVGASSGARGKGWNRTSYIDLYCGPGRARVRGTNQVLHGSPLVAALEARKRVPFSEIHIADRDPENVAVCAARLKAEGFDKVYTYVGEAQDSAREIAHRIGSGLHLAFIDPYNLFPFEILQSLCRLQNIDLLVHVSEQDLQREAIGKRSIRKLDAFVPGWKESGKVDITLKPEEAKAQVFNYWKGLLHAMDMKMRDQVERVRGGNNQPLYWLVLASRADIARALWDKVANPVNRPLFP